MSEISDSEMDIFTSDKTGCLKAFALVVKHVMGRAFQTAKAAMPQRILVVDNDPLNRQIIVRFLREANYEVYEADDGDSAIEMLDKDSFELMICDVLMPRLNGF